MGLSKEILENRARIKEVYDRKCEAFEASMQKPCNELPQGFYKKADQLERFLKSDLLIAETVEQFMDEAGIFDYRLVREFWFTDTVYRPTNMAYKIVFGERSIEDCAKTGCLKCGKISDYQLREHSSAHHTSVFYDPGKNTKSEMLVTGYTHILAPHEKNNRRWLEVEKALKYLRSPGSTFLVTPHVFVLGISRESVRDLLTVILSDPTLKLDLL
ncbi:hypothetical protein HY407_03545, partial [Candidatus Gottesmanbacteria bacterium]|nr:hypothetical protein [Candidatus Gottesmanbacteria bacterium]